MNRRKLEVARALQHLGLMAEDLVRKQGIGAFGTRLRRLSDRIDRDLKVLYGQYGVTFEPCWFPVILALETHGPKTVLELSALTGVNAATLSQVRKRLLEEGLIAASIDTADQRRQCLTLTGMAQDLIERMRPLWAAIARASQGLCEATAPNFLADLETIELALDRRSLSARVNALIRG